MTDQQNHEIETGIIVLGCTLGVLLIGMIVWLI